MLRKVDRVELADPRTLVDLQPRRRFERACPACKALLGASLRCYWGHSDESDLSDLSDDERALVEAKTLRWIGGSWSS